MDQWLWYNPEPSRNRWDRGLEDFFGGLEEEGWCLACGEFGHLVACCPFQEEEDLLPAQKRKRRRGGRSRRRTKEPGASPGWKMEVVPTIPPSERGPPPLLPERELPLEAPVVLRAPARGATKGQEQREPLPHEGEHLWPESELLILGDRESLRPAEDSSLPSAQHGTPALPPKALEGKPDMRGGGLCFRGGGCRSRSYAAWRPVNFLGTKKAKVGVV
ncbi:UNVERIFIED_CONTAM: hypothetical protein FKN15_030971 [Acipenser sinensis]